MPVPPPFTARKTSLFEKGNHQLLHVWVVFQSADAGLARKLPGSISGSMGMVIDKNQRSQIITDCSIARKLLPGNGVL